MGIGETLYLEMEDQKTREKIKFRSRVVEISNQEICIDLPINFTTGKTGFFYIGTHFKAWAYTGDAMFSFNTEIIARKKEKIPMLVLSFPEDRDIERSQRRKYVRVSTTIDVAVHSVDQSFAPFTTLSIDLSGGGAAISLPINHPLVEKISIECWFVLPMQSGEWRYLNIYCEVNRLFEGKNGGKERASLKFDGIKETDRMSIIRYCFEREIQTRNKLVK